MKVVCPVGEPPITLPVTVVLPNQERFDDYPKAMREKYTPVENRYGNFNIDMTIIKKDINTYTSTGC
eukprot:scaffold159394_cov40-Cyclotella_meneghiniana.AAC.1